MTERLGKATSKAANAGKTKIKRVNTILHGQTAFWWLAKIISVGHENFTRQSSQNIQ